MTKDKTKVRGKAYQWIETVNQLGLMTKEQFDFTQLPMQFLNEIIKEEKKEYLNDLYEFFGLLCLDFHNKYTGYSEDNAKIGSGILKKKSHQFHLCCCLERCRRKKDGIVTLKIEDLFNSHLKTTAYIKCTNEEERLETIEIVNKYGFVFEIE